MSCSGCFNEHGGKVLSVATCLAELEFSKFSNEESLGGMDLG